MATLTLTSHDAHDTLTRVLGIFRLMDLPLGGLNVDPEHGFYRIDVVVADDEALIETLVARFARVVSVASVDVGRGQMDRAAA